MARPKKAPRGAKSQAVRDYLTANKDAGPSSVVAALKEQGMSVSLPMVSSKMGLSKKRRRRKVVRTASANGSVGLSVDDLLRAKKLVDQIGAERAKGAIEALARLA